jgi:hypothetical protein
MQQVQHQLIKIAPSAPLPGGTQATQTPSAPTTTSVPQPKGQVLGASIVNCSFTRDLHVGVSGADVKCLQQYLDTDETPLASSGPGSPGHETTYFGQLTKMAVTKWQNKYGVSPAAGYFGPLSRAKYEILVGGQSSNSSQSSMNTPNSSSQTASAIQAMQPLPTPTPSTNSVVPEAVPVYWANCSNPSTDETTAISQDIGQTSLTRKQIESAAELVPVASGITYGQAFEWEESAENAAACFSAGKYAPGINIMSNTLSNAGQTIAVGAIEQTIDFILGAPVSLPADIFQWGITRIENYIGQAQTNDEFMFYFTYMYSCTSGSTSRTAIDTCQLNLLSEQAGENGKYQLLDDYGTFDPDNGFIVAVNYYPPGMSKIIDVAGLENMTSSGVGGVGGIINMPAGLTADKFYRSAEPVYEVILAKQLGSLDTSNSMLVQQFEQTASKLPR